MATNDTKTAETTKRERVVDDKDYIECLQIQVYKNHYYKWRERMLGCIEDIVADLRKPDSDLREIGRKYDLRPRDFALLIQLKYFFPEEVKEFGISYMLEFLPLQ